MKRSFVLLAATIALLMAGCQTPQDRISANRDAFTTYPPDVQAKIQAGLVAVGFTADQVLMARGNPDKKMLRETPNGTEEDWWYGDHRTRIGFGVGGASYGDHSAVAAGASVSGIPIGKDHALHVMLENGHVVALEEPAPGS